jgi:hypothetical protein
MYEEEGIPQIVVGEVEQLGLDFTLPGYPSIDLIVSDFRLLSPPSLLTTFCYNRKMAPMWKSPLAMSSFTSAKSSSTSSSKAFRSRSWPSRLVNCYPSNTAENHSLIFSCLAGFSTIFPVSDLCIFTPEELVLLFGNPVEDWSIEST